MNKPVQQRTLKTRARLMEAAREIVVENGYEGLRIEDVVQRAKVAKGTFFAHFRDKDVLLSLLIGQQLNDTLDQIARLSPPGSVKEVASHLSPLLDQMVQSRLVFDVVLRHSGSGEVETGPIAENFARQIALMCVWFDPSQDHPFRRDISPEMLAEGVQAFATQAMALALCAMYESSGVEDRLIPYLTAWLMPPKRTV